MEIVIHGAAGEVTGSCHLVEAAGRRLLLDCGMVQGDADADARNAGAFPFDPAAIDAMVLSHAHIDHSGRVPLLVQRGFKGPIYTHPATIDLADIMLSDSAQIAHADAARSGAPPPAYTQADVGAALRQMRATAYAAPVEILPGIRLTLRDAGHILGSASVQIDSGEGSASRTLVFSGDLGPTGRPIARDPVPITRADFVVMESTYGDRRHRTHADTLAELGSIFAAANRDGGNVLIPAFAVRRTQAILYLLARYFEEWGIGAFKVFLDSPMAIRVSAAYARHADLLNADAMAFWTPDSHYPRLPNLALTSDPAASRRINGIRGRAIIIAGSGMCTGGRIRHHLRHNLGNPAAHVVVVGYQARGTPGRVLVDGVRSVRLFGEDVPVRAQIHTVGGLSAHADQPELAAWYGGIAGHPPVALVHGEDYARSALAAALREKFGCRVELPPSGTRLRV